MVFLGYSKSRKILLETPSRLVEPGVAWIAPLFSLTSLWPDGWLSFRPAVNTSAPLYSVMKAGFDKYRSAPGLMPTAHSVQAFNAIVGVANALDTMFLKMKPPVYTTSKGFADTFIATIKNYTGPGAGLPIRLNSNGDASYPFEVCPTEAHCWFHLT